MHGCYLESVSRKHRLYADRPGQLQARGIGRRASLLLIATRTAVPISEEWLEAFWCDQCGETQWYHVHRQGDRHYEVRLAPRDLWQQAQGVIHPSGNPSVGEFTRRQARQMSYQGIKDFRIIG